MPQILNKDELVQIMPWHGGYNESPIDLSDKYEVCDWCRKLHKYRLPKDTGDVLYRWSIAIYQLTYIDKMLKANKRDAREWGESIASSFIHAVASFENCGIDCADIITCFDHKVVNSPHTVYRLLLCNLPAVTRQVLYKAMARENRFNVCELVNLADILLNNLIILNCSTNPHLHFSSALMLAMNKLANAELNQH